MTAVPGSDPLTRRSLRLKIFAVLFLLASSLSAQTVGTKDTQVTPVEGQSWIKHLHRSFDGTSMGKTWVLGPAPSEPGEDPPTWVPQLSPGFAVQTATLHGSDLYRLNCQGCHGASGLGAPPEINSVIDPVRATSVTVILERAKKTGQDMSRADAAALARESRVALLDRLHKGGESMPAFPHLNDLEIRSLLAYLEQLSGVPGTESHQIAVQESPFRVGEHIVKSTCHICHSAAGPNPEPEDLMEGVIPPLSSLTTRASMVDFIKKVTNGSTVLMGGPPLSVRDYYRGRMPVFRYLTQDEAADAYLYLSLYPPHQ